MFSPSDLLDGRDAERAIDFARQFQGMIDRSSILVAGATGFVGSWVLASISTLADVLGVDLQIRALVRDVHRARATLAGIAPKLAIDVIPVEDCSQVGHVDQIWHFSAQTGSSGVASTGEIVGADVGFTSLLLEVAARQATPPRFLYASSGAVYGRSRPSPVLLTETSPVAVFESSQPYDLAKGASELLLRAATIDGQINSRIARLFAFVGPRLPLHAHFAIGNFIADAAAGKVVVVRSGGVDRRSWMYAGDMANVLIGMAFGDSPQVLNVGGGEAMSIAAAAERVANIAGVEFVVQGDLAAAPTYYVPEISLLESTFPEANWTTFDDSVIRTINWARTQTAVGNLY